MESDEGRPRVEFEEQPGERREESIQSPLTAALDRRELLQRELTVAESKLQEAWDRLVYEYGLLRALDRDQDAAAGWGMRVGLLLGLVAWAATVYPACRWVLTGEWLLSFPTPSGLLAGIYGVDEREMTTRGTLLTAVVALLVGTMSPMSTFLAARSTPARARLKGATASKVFVHEWKLDPAGWRALVSVDHEVGWVPAEQLTPEKKHRWFRGTRVLLFRENLKGGAFGGLVVGVAYIAIMFLVATVLVAWLIDAPPSGPSRLDQLADQYVDQLILEPVRAKLVLLQRVLILGLLSSLAFGAAIAMQWRNRHRSLTHAAVSRHGRQYVVRVLAIRDVAGAWYGVIEVPREPQRGARVLGSMLLIWPLLPRRGTRRVLPLETLGTLGHAR